MFVTGSAEKGIKRTLLKYRFFSTPLRLKPHGRLFTDPSNLLTIYRIRTRI